MAKGRPIVTLLTDFGAADGYVAAMKGVMLTIRPDLTIVDVSHQIPPGSIAAGAFVLNQVVDYFPPGTVHLAVVDPGVGTDRNILAIRYAGQTIVTPDNGLISLLDARLQMEAIVLVRNADFFVRDRVGATFDGRDVMAPVAVALAGGDDIHHLGPPPDAYTLRELPQPTWDETALTGAVLYIDRFGNCITNIGRDSIGQCLPRTEAIGVWVGQKGIGPLQVAFAHVDEGEALALLNSMDLLEIAVNAGRADEALSLSVGDEVSVSYADQ